MSKLPKNLSKDINKVYGSIRASAGSAAGATSRAATSMQEATFRHANTATAVARERVFPVVQHCTDAAMKHSEPYTRPVTKAVNTHVTPRYMALERDFERALHGTPKLQVAATAAVIFLLAVWLATAIVRWLTTPAKETVAQRSTRAFRSLPGIKGQVEKMQAAAVDAIKAQVAAHDPPVEPLLELPPAGADSESVMQVSAQQCTHGCPSVAPR